MPDLEHTRTLSKWQDEMADQALGLESLQCIVDNTHIVQGEDG